MSAALVLTSSTPEALIVMFMPVAENLPSITNCIERSSEVFVYAACTACNGETAGALGVALVEAGPPAVPAAPPQAVRVPTARHTAVDEVRTMRRTIPFLAPEPASGTGNTQRRKRFRSCLSPERVTAAGRQVPSDQSLVV